MSLPPLVFRPVFKQYVWGGRRLADRLGKSIPIGETCAESWELVDRRDEQSVVERGRLAGTPLRTLVAESRADLMGNRAPDSGVFPWLFKFLDARLDLSVQVHPNDEQAARQQPPDLGKTEAWVVLEAELGSRVYAGLQPGVTLADLRKAVTQGNVESCLHSFEPQKGDCIFLPAGTIHALGAGLLVAEIQQNSDTTYRLFDWNRTDAQGNRRPLHVDAGMDVSRDGQGPVGPQVPWLIESGTERLVACPYFELDRTRIEASQMIAADQRLHFWAVLEGQGNIQCDQGLIRLQRGTTILLPAHRDALAIETDSPLTILDVQFPNPHRPR